MDGALLAGQRCVPTHLFVEPCLPTLMVWRDGERVRSSLSN